jgi:hypothetical protein
VLGQMKILEGTREGLVSRPEVAATGFRVGRRLINGSAGSHANGVAVAMSRNSILLSELQCLGIDRRLSEFE